MKQHQETIYKVILIFSAIINLFLIGLMFLVFRDSSADEGERLFLLQGKSFWFFTAIVMAYSLANAIFIVRFLKFKNHNP